MKAREKDKHRFGILWNYLDECLTKFKDNQILLNKISHRFLLTTELLTGRKSLILPMFLFKIIPMWFLPNFLRSSYDHYLDRG